MLKLIMKLTFRLIAIALALVLLPSSLVFVRLRNIERAPGDGYIMTSDSVGRWTAAVPSSSSADPFRLFESDQLNSAVANTPSSSFAWTSGGPGTGIISSTTADTNGVVFAVNGTNSAWWHARPTLTPFKPWLHDSCVILLNGKGSSVFRNLIGMLRTNTYDGTVRTLLNPDTTRAGCYFEMTPFSSSFFIRPMGAGLSDTVEFSVSTTLDQNYKFKFSYVDSCEIWVNNVLKGKTGPMNPKFVVQPTIATFGSGTATRVKAWAHRYYPKIVF
jgi:hypothetical protein